MQMYKLLVNTPSGKQELIEVTATGGYFDTARVLWDERTDGALPAVDLGKMQRDGDQLVTLADVLPEHAAAVIAESIPDEVDMTQARLALFDAGLLANVEAYIEANFTEREKIFWKTRRTIRRDNELVEKARVGLGLTHEQMDDLFIAAKVLV